MKTACLPILLLKMLFLASPLSAQEYIIDLESDGKQIAVIELSINDDEAIAKVADVTERFDLKNQRWQHAESGQWVSLTQYEAWAKKSKEKTSASTASISDEIRLFIDWSLSPEFKVESNGPALTLTSGQVDYEITGTKTDRDLINYFRYARLNAYKKAMTGRKLPPFAELKVLEELERRHLMPTTMIVQIPGVPGAPVLEMSVRNKANR